MVLNYLLFVNQQQHASIIIYYYIFKFYFPNQLIEVLNNINIMKLPTPLLGVGNLFLSFSHIPKYP